ncbi:MAG TPA: four helix bundle protein [Terriglobales bacterium]|nr:four helix bundle protein [Terriglobales bacterium]
MRNFRELKVWEKSHALTLDVYRATQNFPKQEQYLLTSQLRRAAQSIPENIAEGAGKDSRRDFGRFLQIAKGSASELEYELLLAKDLHYLNETDYARMNEAVVEIKRMLTGFLQYLEQPVAASS